MKFDKKVDPRKLAFGSKVDNSDSKREEYYRVKEIISPELLVLDNGQKIRLLGVKEIAEKAAEAVNFLRGKTRGRKVFLKFDSVKYDDRKNLHCYLYLKNKTFVNAHLIKKGLAAVDKSVEFSCRAKFEKL